MQPVRKLAWLAVVVAATVAPGAGATVLEATVVRVLDEPPVVVVAVTPVRAYQPGDYVWKTTPPTARGGVGTMDVGCDRVPATGYIGTNVYAESGAHYANYWSWGSGSSGEPYYWYVKKTDGTTQDWGYTSGGDQSSVPANVYRWKVQNKGATPQAWNVCFDVV